MPAYFSRVGEPVDRSHHTSSHPSSGATVKTSFDLPVCFGTWHATSVIGRDPGASLCFLEHGHILDSIEREISFPEGCGK